MNKTTQEKTPKPAVIIDITGYESTLGSNAKNSKTTTERLEQIWQLLYRLSACGFKISPADMPARQTSPPVTTDFRNAFNAAAKPIQGEKP